MKTIALAVVFFNAVLCAAGAEVVISAAAVFNDRSFEAVIRETLNQPLGVVLDQDLATLTQLSAPDSGITSLEGIQHCVNLKTLNVAGNGITDLKPLAGLSALESVDLSNNRIGDISPLVAGDALGDGDLINLVGNPLTQPSVCKFIPALQRRKVEVIFAGQCSLDSDGDGLSDEAEAALGTDVTLADTDGDGMADGFEAARGLDPLVKDALLDDDDDGLTNLEEFYRGSDPASAASPTATFFLSPDGDDGNDGSFDNPWRTITHALAKTFDYPSANIALMAGVYTGNVTLNPGTRLVGIRPGVVVKGFIIGAPSTALVNFELTESALLTNEVVTLLTMADSAMAVLNVTFRGTAGHLTRAIVVTGDIPGRSLIARCSFTDLRTGVDIFGEIPRILRCSFDSISGSAIIFRFVQLKNSADGDGTYAPTDGNSGYNSFTNIEGDYVINMRPDKIDMRNNYWGTEDPDEIADLVSGDVDTSSSLKSSGLVPATVVCCLWNAETMAPISTGSIFLAPGAFLPLTENMDGVYTMACVPPGDYTVTATAAGYVHGAQNVSLDSGDEVSLVFPLAPGEDDPGDGCFASTFRAEPPKTPPAALFIIALLLALPWKRRPRRFAAPRKTSA